MVLRVRNRNTRPTRRPQTEKAGTEQQISRSWSTMTTETKDLRSVPLFLCLSRAVRKISESTTCCRGQCVYPKPWRAKSEGFNGYIRLHVASPRYPIFLVAFWESTPWERRVILPPIWLESGEWEILWNLVAQEMLFESWMELEIPQQLKKSLPIFLKDGTHRRIQIQKRHVISS